jgi:N-acetylmuramic acid 6-phosphate etherase
MTEAPDPRFRDVDAWTPLEAATAIWETQLAAVAAIGPALPAIADAIEGAADRLSSGEGRLAYAGAGTSARLAAQDGSELPPTFGWPAERLLFLAAGGAAALAQAAEDAEDDAEAGAAGVRAAGIGPADVLIGLAASGRTPFTVAALDAARRGGALTIGVANNSGTPVLRAADHAILADTGAEVVAGSTRMKAGTAQKVILNILSTGIMARLGRVHAGLMVDMRPTNAKLRERAARIVAGLAGVGEEAARDALLATDWRIKEAVLLARGMAPAEAAERLAAAGGRLRDAL